MIRVLLAPAAVFLHLDPLGIIFLVLHSGIVAPLAFAASQSHNNAHDSISSKLLLN